MNAPSPASSPTAALLIIGNEILSGRTQDANLHAAATRLNAVGIVLKEVRVVADITADIVEAVNILRARYTYLFTTGGIGPTHDDITVDAIASAFGVGVEEHPDARALLTRYYGVENLTDARLRMARVPAGATLIDNPVSAAPGIKIANVYIMAGVPKIMQAMMDTIILTLRHGAKIHSRTLSAYIAESAIAHDFGAIAARYPQLDLGSYPWVKDARFGTALVSRGTDEQAVSQAADEIRQMVESRGADIIPWEG